MFYPKRRITCLNKKHSRLNYFFMKTDYSFIVNIIAIAGLAFTFGCSKDTPNSLTEETNLAAADRDICVNAIQIRLISVSGGSTTEPEFSVYNSIEPWGYVLNIGNGCCECSGNDIGPWHLSGGGNNNSWQSLTLNNSSTLTVSLEDISTPAFACEGEQGLATFQLRYRTSSNPITYNTSPVYTLYYNDNNHVGEESMSFTVTSNCRIDEF